MCLSADVRPGLNGYLVLKCIYSEKIFVRKNVTSVSPLKVLFVSNDASLQVCPWRTMLFYLDAVAPLRAPTKSLLFISHSVDTVYKVIPHGVSRYVIHAIRWAYNVPGKASLDCRAHDVRKIIAFLRA